MAGCVFYSSLPMWLLKGISSWIRLLRYKSVTLFKSTDLKYGNQCKFLSNSYSPQEMATLKRRLEYFNRGHSCTYLNAPGAQTCSLTAEFHWRRSQRVQSSPGIPLDSDFGQYTPHKHLRCRIALLHPGPRDPLSVYFHLGINRGKIRTSQIKHLLFRTIASSSLQISILIH